MSEHKNCGVRGAPPHPERIYADRDIIEQCSWYALHVYHMTSEELHSKSDIAAELAHRDIQIETLRARIEELESTNAEWNPRWSAAPDRAVGWKIGYSQKPYWVLNSGRFVDAPKFGYSGAWEDSWRLRP
jgi:hypothetical protein